MNVHPSSKGNDPSCWKTMLSCFGHDKQLPEDESPKNRVLSFNPTLLARSNTMQLKEADLWKIACKRLDKETRIWLSQFRDERKWDREVTEELVKIVNDEEEKYVHSGAIKIGKHEFTWREYASRVVTVVTAVGDVAVHFAPPAASIIWSPIKTLMQAHVNQCENMTAALGCTEEVLVLFRRCQIYEVVYLQKGAGYTDAMKELQKHLVEAYVSVIEILYQISAKLDEALLKQFFKALVDGKNSGPLSSLEKHKDELDRVAQICGNEQSFVASEQHKKLLESLSQPLRRIDFAVDAMLKRMEQSEADKVLDYVSDIPYGDHHRSVKENRTLGTCEWLLNHKRFLEWEKSRGSCIFWLQGGVGAGKSVLTSKVIDRYSVNFNDTPKDHMKHDEGFAYFYCNRDDPARRQASSIYQSYIKQLARPFHRRDSIHKELYKLYETAHESRKVLYENECHDMLRKLTDSYPRSVLILDGLDECEDDSGFKIARFLSELAEQSKSLLQIFIASRKEANIEDSLRCQDLIYIDATDNKADIEKYMKGEMKDLCERNRIWHTFTGDFRTEIIRAIVDKSDGMFRWAYLQWIQLQDCKTISGVESKLKSLPKGLTEAYHEIYKKNTTTKDGDVELEARAYLQQAAKWVMCAKKPLSSDELLAAIRLHYQVNEAGDHILQTPKEEIEEASLEEICRHLIVKDSQLGVWRFPHASVAEYFENEQKEWMKKAPEEVTILLILALTACYSNFPMFDSRYDYDNFMNPSYEIQSPMQAYHPLQIYVSQQWVYHAQEFSIPGSGATSIAKALKAFLGNEGPENSSTQYQAWLQHLTWNRDRSPRKLKYEIDDLKPATNSVFFICTFALHHILQGWW